MRGNSRSRWMLGAAGAAALSLVLSACGGNSNDGGTPGATGGAGADAVITVNGSEPQNPLYPANTNETGGGRIMSMLFKGLIDYDAEGNPRNQVAESIDTTDSQNFTIKLKDGWKFSNGEAVTAKSFVDAWNYGALSTNAQLNSYFFEPIEGYADVHPSEEGAKPKAETMSGLKVVDDHTFTVKLSSPQSSFPLRLGYTAFVPLPSDAYKDTKAFGESPIGNGPYVLDGAWQHSVQIKVKKNPSYQGVDKPKNSGVLVKFYQSQDSAYQDLIGNNLDVLDAVPPSAFATFESDLGDRAINQAAGIFQSFTFPLYEQPWKGANGAKIRQAISMAINRDEITKTIFNGTRTPATDYTSPVVQGYSKDIGGDLLTYNPDAAKKLLAEAGGYAGPMSIGYNADGGHKEWVDAVCNSIQTTLNIKCEGKAYPEFKALRKDVTAHQMKSAFRTGWQMDYPAIDNFLGPLYAKGAGSNDGLYDNPEFDALLKKGDTATSAEAGIASYQEAEKVLIQDMPSIPLWYSNATGGYSEKVSNVKFDVFSVPIYTEITRK